ncbi:MAG: tetratricopeptide repeat protein [Proteobacteria bacterium]|nr:tetratricopeptide repeat protein [Pseudomonadota bacterium]
MLHDSYGNAVDTDNAATVAALDRFARSFLAYGKDFAVIFEAAADDPDCLLARTQGALLGLFMENNAGLALATEHLEAGQALVATGAGTERERLYFRAVEAAARADVTRATAAHEELADSWPRDLFAAKLGQIHYFNVGDATGMRRIAQKTCDAHGETAYAWGLLAFGLEECGELDEAERVGRRAAEMTEVEPWAHHAVAHVYETRGDLAGGIAWMEDRAHTWRDCNSFMFTHNWWHIALFYLDQGDTDQALRIYDTRLWGAPQGDRAYSQDQAGAVSMLIRLSLRGLVLDGRWSDVADEILNREVMYDQPFLTAHYDYALARSEHRTAYEHFLQGLHDHAGTLGAASAPLRHMWLAHALPLCRGIGAHADNDFALAATLLGETRPHWQGMGGSHAQRDLFEQMYLDALIRSGRSAEALPILATRARHGRAWRYMQRSWRRRRRQRAFSRCVRRFPSTAS